MSSETTEKVAELKKALFVTGPFALPPVKFRRDASYVIRVSHVEVPQGIQFEAALKPEFWAHVARDLMQGQRILVDAEDNSFSAQLKVLSTKGITPDRPVIAVTVEWVKQEKAEELPEAAGSPEDAYRVHFAGGAKWRITRKSDEATISDGHASKALAQEALRGHLQAKAA